MNFKKLFLSIFLSLVVFSQMYSLVAGMHTIVMMTPERIEDTDPEDIVTIDPLLPASTDQVARALKELAGFAIVPWLTELGIYLLPWSSPAVIAPVTLSDFSPVAARVPLWLSINRLLI